MRYINYWQVNGKRCDWHFSVLFYHTVHFFSSQNDTQKLSYFKYLFWLLLLRPHTQKKKLLPFFRLNNITLLCCYFRTPVLLYLPWIIDLFFLLGKRNFYKFEKGAKGSIIIIIINWSICTRLKYQSKKDPFLIILPFWIERDDTHIWSEWEKYRWGDPIQLTYLGYIIEHVCLKMVQGYGCARYPFVFFSPLCSGWLFANLLCRGFEWRVIVGAWDTNSVGASSFPWSDRLYSCPF